MPEGSDTLFASMRRLRRVVGSHEDLSRGLTARQRRALPRPVRQLQGQGQRELPLRRPSGGAHPPGDRQRRSLRQQGVHPKHQRHPAHERQESSVLFEHGNLVPVPLSLAPNPIAFWDNRCVSTTRCGTIVAHTRSGNRVTVKGDRPVLSSRTCPSPASPRGGLNFCSYSCMICCLARSARSILPAPRWSPLAARSATFSRRRGGRRH